MDQEKRKRTRVPVHFDVAVTVHGKTIQVQIINISLTGILCTSNPLFQANDACKVIISLSDDLKIAIENLVDAIVDVHRTITAHYTILTLFKVPA